MDVKNCSTSAEAMEVLGMPRYYKRECLYRLSADSAPMDFPKRKVIIDPEGMPIATVGEGYEIFQPVHALETAYEVARSTGGKVEAFHFIRGNKRNVVDISLPGEHNIGAKRDPIQAHAWIYNPCDGGGSLVFGLTGKRFFCQNQIAAFMKSASIRVQHRALMHSRFESAIRAAGYILNRLPDMIETLSGLTVAPMSSVEMSEFIDKLIPSDSTRSSNVKDSLMQKFEHGIGAEVYPETRWNAYNAVTEHLTHTVAHRKNGRDRVMAGSGLRMEIQALELLVN